MCDESTTSAITGANVHYVVFAPGRVSVFTIDGRTRVENARERVYVFTTAYGNSVGTVTRVKPSDIGPINVFIEALERRVEESEQVKKF